MTWWLTGRDWIATREGNDGHERKSVEGRSAAAHLSVPRRVDVVSSPLVLRRFKKKFSGNLGTASERGAVTKRRPKRGTADGA